MINSTCPFDEGDRVDHRKFGFGTVSGAPVAMMRAGLQRSESAGWNIPVRWDDATCTANRVGSDFLTKVSSPDERPFAYWDRKWQPLLANWLEARRNFENAAKHFRPAPSASELKSLADAEAKAFSALESFRAEEAARVAGAGQTGVLQNPAT
jgi:hypothetical protein